MKKKSIVALLSLITGFCLSLCPIPLSAQTEGDQILDGIGETALIARYMFEGNTEDRARNHFHATLIKGEAVYADERPFNKALSLTGGYLQIPDRALISADSLSVAGWVFLNSAAPGQRLFDFGLDAGHSFFCELTGTEEASGFRARITADGPETEQGPVAKAIPTSRWFHLTIVLDAANHTLSSYINDRPASRKM